MKGTVYKCVTVCVIICVYLCVNVGMCVFVYVCVCVDVYVCVCKSMYIIMCASNNSRKYYFKKGGPFSKGLRHYIIIRNQMLL